MKPVRLSLFWKLGLTYVLLLLLVLLAVDIFAARSLRRDYLRAGFEQLDSLAQLVETRPPRFDSSAELAAWADWLARSGARVTVVAADGLVLADSAEDPQNMENHANRPEIQEAMASGRGTAVRYSQTVEHELLYLALLHETEDGQPVVVRLALPLAEIDEALADIRRRLWMGSLVILLLAGGVSLVVSRAFYRRVERLKQFSRRVAEGDFKPLPPEGAGDELAELALALNETARQLEQTIRSLTDERNRSAAILRSMVEGVAVISAGERIVFCNEAFCHSVGAEFACEGRPAVEVLRQPELLALVRQVLREGNRVSGEVEVRAGRAGSFAVTAAPVRADSTTGAVLVLHDITELRRLERVRRDFVANISHEFKTPLTAIQGFAETLLGGALEDRKNSQRFLEIIRDHAARLGRLTDDLLKLSQIEAGR
ncbi:MAG: PAS domain-containing protein, partial [Desulfuromonadales bacterium]|nr:PAS domain-containing protein [Desulfuromonadales bacterium]